MAIFLVVQLLYHTNRYDSLSVSLSHKHAPTHTVCEYRYML